MATVPDLTSGFMALTWFGFGARGHSLDLVLAASDPRGLLKDDLERGRVSPANDSLGSTTECLQALFAERQRTQAKRQTTAMPQPVVPGGQTSQPQEAAPNANAALLRQPPVPQQLFRREALARFQQAATVRVGFAERLVQFWSNQFAVSALKGGVVRATVGSFEREAIRPHVLGRFRDIVQAVVAHPAMLAYLDNSDSLGPNAPAGKTRKRGLNENLAREVLELHTLGADGGYAQADVTALAAMLTGWTFAGAPGRVGEPGVFTFFAHGHEPGDKTLLGKRYRDGGLEQGQAALDDLARHPSTARHIALKFARHFVADDPPASLVQRLEAVFNRSEGDLMALAVALVDADDA